MKDLPEYYYYYQNKISLTAPSDNPGDPNVDRAIADESNIVAENVQTLSNKKKKRKIILNLSQITFILTLDNWESPTLLNHCILLLHEGFEIYRIGEENGKKCLFPITGLFCDFIDFTFFSLSNKRIKKFFPDIKENETLIFEDRHLIDMADLDNQFIHLQLPPLENQTKFNEMPTCLFYITEAKVDDIIKYFRENRSIAIKTKKLKLNKCAFKKGEVEGLFALLPNLEVLTLKNSFLLGPITGDLKLSTLKKLYLYFEDTEIEFLKPENFIQLINAAPSLQILDVYASSLRKAHLIPFHHCKTHFLQKKTLHILILQSVQINCAQLSQLLSSSLVILDLPYSYISGSFKEKKKLPHLTKFSAYHAALSQELLSDFFTASRNLKEVNLYNVKFTQNEVKPISLSHNSLRNLIVDENFLNHSSHIKIGNKTFPCLESTFVHSIQRKSGFTDDNIMILINLLKQFNDKNFRIRARVGPEQIIFNSTRSHDAQQRMCSFSKCNQKAIEQFMDFCSINAITLDGISFSHDSNKAKFLSHLYSTQIPIVFANMHNIAIRTKDLERINLNFSSKVSLILLSENDDCYFIIKGQVNVVEIKKGRAEGGKGKISTASLAELFKKFPKGVSLRLMDIEITGDFSILPPITIKDLALIRVNLDGPCVDQLWSSVSCQNAEVENILVCSKSAPALSTLFEILYLININTNNLFITNTVDVDPKLVVNLRAKFLENLNDFLKSLIRQQGLVEGEARVKKIFMALTVTQQQFINACYYSLKKFPKLLEEFPKVLKEIKEANPRKKINDREYHINEATLPAVSRVFLPLSNLLRSMATQDSTRNLFRDDSLVPVFQLLSANYDEIKQHTMSPEPPVVEQDVKNRSIGNWYNYGTFKSVNTAASNSEANKEGSQSFGSAKYR